MENLHNEGGNKSITEAGENTIQETEKSFQGLITFLKQNQEDIKATKQDLGEYKKKF